MRGKMRVTDLFKIFNENDFELYYVGGYVRDYIMGRKSHDIDLATNARPEEMLKMIQGSRFLKLATVTISLVGKKVAEITTYRKKESYTEGSRMPDVVLGGNIEKDLKRRDFTINAMAMTEFKTLIDLYGGEGDIEARIINTPDDSFTTFSEDPLRMLRVARFISQLDFSPHELLWGSCYTLRHKLTTVSMERVLMEMDKLLIGRAPDRGLDFLLKTGLIDEFIPEIFQMKDLDQGETWHNKDVWSHTKEVIFKVSPEKNLRWAALLHDIAKPLTRTVKKGVVHFYRHEELGAKMAEEICRRLKMSNKDIHEIVFLIRNHMRIGLYIPKWKNAAVYRLVRDAGSYLPNMFKLSRADITSRKHDRVIKWLEAIDELESRAGKIEKVEEKIRIIRRMAMRKIVERMGLKGRKIGELKDWLEGEIVDGRIGRNLPASHYIRYVKGNYVY